MLVFLNIKNIFYEHKKNYVTYKKKKKLMLRKKNKSPWPLPYQTRLWERVTYGSRGRSIPYRISNRRNWTRFLHPLLFGWPKLDPNPTWPKTKMIQLEMTQPEKRPNQQRPNPEHESALVFSKVLVWDRLIIRRAHTSSAFDKCDYLHLFMLFLCSLCDVLVDFRWCR